MAKTIQSHHEGLKRNKPNSKLKRCMRKCLHFCKATPHFYFLFAWWLQSSAATFSPSLITPRRLGSYSHFLAKKRFPDKSNYANVFYNFFFSISCKTVLPHISLSKLKFTNSYIDYYHCFSTLLFRYLQILLLMYHKYIL